MKVTVAVLALAACGFAQQAPAPVLEIARESVKEGRGPAHEKVEMDFAGLFRKANHPAHYVALSAMSGAPEMWFVVPAPSFAAMEEWQKLEGKEPLKSALAMIESRDGELRSSSRTMLAVYRPDLSYKPERFNRSKTHYVMLATFRVKMGHDDEFMAGAKTYYDGWDKANVDICELAYQVTAGAPAGTYLIMMPMESLKAVDGGAARGQAIMQAMGPENFAKFMRSAENFLVSVEDTLLAVRPSMSYVPQETIDGDPAFWKPKPMAKPAAPAGEKKSGQ